MISLPPGSRLSGPCPPAEVDHQFQAERLSTEPTANPISVAHTVTTTTHASSAGTCRARIQWTGAISRGTVDLFELLAGGRGLS